MSEFDMVWEFHSRFNAVLGDLADPKVCALELRHKLITEEFGELIAEARKSEPDMAAVAKELADLLYVVYGTAVAWGIDIEDVFHEVHRSNMTKTAGLEREDGKILKGPGYKSPDIAAVLKRQVAIYKSLLLEGERIPK